MQIIRKKATYEGVKLSETNRSTPLGICYRSFRGQCFYTFNDL